MMLGIAVVSRIARMRVQRGFVVCVGRECRASRGRLEGARRELRAGAIAEDSDWDRPGRRGVERCDQVRGVTIDAIASMKGK